MALTYKQFYSELLNTFPRLSTFMAQRLINRALQEIYNSRQWSFLRAFGLLYSPPLISTGSFNVTQFSNTPVANAAAITALTGLSNPLITSRQIRLGASPPYNITNFDTGTGVLTLDRPVVETSNAASTYRLYRCYYGPPLTGINGVETTDFKRYNSIYNPTISQYFVKLHLSGELLNQLDPQRNIFSNPRYLYSHSSSSTGTPQFEMHPHSMAAVGFPCSYQRKGIFLSNDTDTLPLILDDLLVIEAASMHACDWAAKNVSRYPELKGVNWVIMGQKHKKTYSNISAADPGLLELAHRDDEEAFPQDEIIKDSYRQIRVVGTDDATGFFSIP